MITLIKCEYYYFTKNNITLKPIILIIFLIGYIYGNYIFCSINNEISNLILLH